MNQRRQMAGTPAGKILGLVTLGLALLPATNAGAEPDARSGRCVYAVVRSVDAARNSLCVTVHDEDDDPIEHTVMLGRDVSISLLAKPKAKLADLAPSMRIAVVLTADERSVQSVREWKSLRRVPADKQPGVVGVVKSVDAEKRRMTVTVQESGRPARLTLAVSSSAGVTLQAKQPAQLGQLKAGMRVVLTLREPDGKVRAVTVVAEEKR